MKYFKEEQVILSSTDDKSNNMRTKKIPLDLVMRSMVTLTRAGSVQC